MFGVCDDYSPSKEAAEDLAGAAPQAKWVVHSHTGWTAVHGQPVGCLASVWGIYEPRDPDVPTLGGASRYYGFKSPVRVLRFGRNDFRQRTALAVYRIYTEGWIVAPGKWAAWSGGRTSSWSGTIGVGRMGADFWPIRTGSGGRTASLAGAYAPWGGLDLNEFGVTYVVGPGRDGPVTTVRFEALRECLQDNEARVFLERVLTDPAGRARIGEELAGRAQAILDERVRAYIAFDIGYTGRCDTTWYLGSDWQERSARLYAVAAEVAAGVKGE